MKYMIHFVDGSEIEVEMDTESVNRIESRSLSPIVFKSAKQLQFNLLIMPLAIAYIKQKGSP